LPTALKRILCVGECLIDVLPSGKRPGGAPSNVAFHLAQSGLAAVALCSRVGRDAHGDSLRYRLSEAGVDVGLLQTDEVNSTGVVHVKHGANDLDYDIAAPAAWDDIAQTPGALQAARQAAVVVYGTLAQRHPISRSTVRTLVAQARAAGALALVDLNLRAPFFDEEIILWSLRNCDVLKLNSGELQTVSALFGARGDDQALLEGLVREFALPRAVLTCGAEGSRIFEHGRRWLEPAVPIAACDGVGAGDAMTAILASALALGVPWDVALPFAAEASAFVVSQEGAMPHWPVALVDHGRSVFSGST
jgi:fructokinase